MPSLAAWQAADIPAGPDPMIATRYIRDIAKPPGELQSIANDRPGGRVFALDEVIEHGPARNSRRRGGYRDARGARGRSFEGKNRRRLGPLRPIAILF